MTETTLSETGLHAIVLAGHPHANWAPGSPQQPAAALPGLGVPLIHHTLRWLDTQHLASITLVSRERPAVLAPCLLGLTTPTRHHLEHHTQGAEDLLRHTARRHAGTVLLVEGPVRSDLDLQSLWQLHRRTGATITCVLVHAERAPDAPRVVRNASGRILHVGSALELPAATEALAGITLVETQGISHVGTDQGVGHHGWVQALIAAGQPVFGLSWEGDWNAAWDLKTYARHLHETLATQPAGSYIAPDARVDPRATLHAPYYIGAGSRIDAEAEVGPYASVEAGVRIGRGSQLQHCQVLPYTRVGAGGRWAHGLLYPHGFTAWEGAGTPEDAGEMLNSTWQEPWNEKLHTWFDQVFAAVLLFLSAPVWLLIITAIKLDSPGPAFYTQLRRGQDPRPYRLGSPRGEVFACYKFRTMHADADRRLQELRARNQYGQGAFFKLADDPRITRVGVFLRKTSLDELPQLINVLKGEMRLVGNRPLPLYEAEALREDWQRTRFLAPAGITGLWQISGRSDLSEKERLVLDTYYSVTRSFWGDWGILLRTVPALIRQRGAR